ncbi:putative transcription factor [Phaeomoniella chlamydospora]|uniref:Putative transcription factor n=1 Tax=Phaeomoniella chlamydospora TaxID=158046 RepID=A0A0G2FXV0_PHACM|nr:putative transcription factor [Phaeomoniella chlamydospora]
MSVHLQLTSPLSLRGVDASVTFETCPDNTTLFHADDENDLDKIEQVVHPHGPALVHLYFRIVHPTYPILHKKVFLEKYDRSYREFSPPLLAAVYLLAMNWWEYDRDLSLKTKPDQHALVRLATKTIADVVYRPKLSTVQAGLLLLQRARGDSWVLTSQLVAVGEELGLHLDCTTWSIPEWERGLRRRLAWALYMQDKWGALIHGRPSHIDNKTWSVRHVSSDDFPESAADEDDEEGSTEVEKGRTLFQCLIRLSETLADILDILYTLDGTRDINTIVSANGILGLLELVKPVSLKLRQWITDLPICLNMDDLKTRKLCSNGYLHLSYYIAEISIHRCIIRALHSPLCTTTPSHLFDICRDAAKMRFLHSLQFIESLRPEHLQSFWWFMSAKSLALIGSFGALLWATSTSEEEAHFYRQKIDDYRWTLKVRSKSVSFVEVGIEELATCMPPDLDLGKVNSGVKTIPAYPSSAAGSQTTITTPRSNGDGLVGQPQTGHLDHLNGAPYHSDLTQAPPEGTTPFLFEDNIFALVDTPGLYFEIDGQTS